jgi:hypothetical protein
MSEATPPDSHRFSESRLLELLPRDVAKLRNEAAFHRIAPWFLRSLSVPGDICEFGCFRGYVSIKLAFALKALGIEKTVYAFDTFEGFQVADPAGGSLGIGAYSDNDNAFDELSRWGAVLPLRPVKGDARRTCKMLRSPLSFVWLDIDFDVLMAPVLETITPLIGPETIIGIDDVGRPETPSVQGWVDRMIAEGRLVELERYPEEFIWIFRRGS